MFPIVGGVKVRKKKGSYCECDERKSLTLGIKTKRNN